MRLRHGYTLTELALVLSIVGILAGIGVPHVLRVRDTLAVEEAARRIAAAHQRARITAILRNCAMVLTISADSITLRAQNEVAASSRDMGVTANSVTYGGPLRQVTFSPIGLPIGVANATYTVTRGDARRSVVVSRLGRVRITS
jgi:prepilin-type N-terminal cleavage/methylation domain-containing protein